MARLKTRTQRHELRLQIDLFAERFGRGFPGLRAVEALSLVQLHDYWLKALSDLSMVSSRCSGDIMINPLKFAYS
jgi:hypothetical protein